MQKWQCEDKIFLKKVEILNFLGGTLPKSEVQLKL